MTRRRRSSIEARKLKKLLRNLPDDITKPVADVVQANGARLLAEMRRGLDGSDVAQGLTVKRLQKGMVAKVGLNTKAAKRKYWYWIFIEVGAKPHEITYDNGRTIQHPGRAANPFRKPAEEKIRPMVKKEISEAIDVALRRASRG